MIDLNKLRAMGEPWCCWGIDLTKTESVLAIPRNSFRVGPGIQGGPRAFHGERIVILGYYADFLSDAAGEGFSLNSRSQIHSPGGTTDLTIVTHLATNAVPQFTCVPECFIPLDAGASSPSLANGAQLVVKEVGSLVSGTLVIWGVTMPSQEQLLTNRYFGSPFALNAIPPTTP